MRASLQILYTPWVSKYIVGKKNKILRFFCLLFYIFSFFAISHSNVIQRRMYVKDFSRNTLPKIYFEIWIKCWVLLVVLCERESGSSYLSYPIFFHFALSTHFWHILLGACESQSSNFESGQVYCGKEKEDNVSRSFPFHRLLFAFSSTIVLQDWGAGDTSQEVIQGSWGDWSSWSECCGDQSKDTTFYKNANFEE